jgi:predicted kinase
MKKVIMLRGIPGSGKSTKAKELITSGGDYVRVNKDLLRTMLHFDKWTGKNESITALAENILIRGLIKEGKNVIVDNTNLTERHEKSYKSVADELGAEFQVVEIDTPFEECIARDSLRLPPARVGRDVILRFALMTGKYPKPEKPLVICDIDGTIANITHRLQYAKGETKNWKTFFDLMYLDSVREDTLKMLYDYQEAGHKIIFVSARPENYRDMTNDWLRNMVWERGVYYEGVIMRREHDKRDDVEVKSDIYEDLFRGKYDIETVIDDRPKVIRMWRAKGLNVQDVGEGIEF